MVCLSENVNYPWCVLVRMLIMAYRSNISENVNYSMVCVSENVNHGM